MNECYTADRNVSTCRANVGLSKQVQRYITAIKRQLHMDDTERRFTQTLKDNKVQHFHIELLNPLFYRKKIKSTSTSA